VTARKTGVVLASTSAYRAELLRRVLDDFSCQAPQVDESALANESPMQTAIWLAHRKACAVAASLSGGFVIGSDQVAEFDGRAIGKPGSLDNARSQLNAFAGRTLRFHTAVCLVDLRSDRRIIREACDLTIVHFRNIGHDEIDRYLETDQPFDCAGSFKIEKRGISLFERVECDDPTALVGLPLIATCRLLREAGHPLP